MSIMVEGIAKSLQNNIFVVCNKGKGRSIMIKVATPEGAGFSKKAIEDFARHVSSKLSFTAGSSVRDFVKKIGGKISVGAEDDDEINGGSIIINSKKDFHIYLSSITSVERDNFTIAHELGHFFIHYHKYIKDNPECKNEKFRATRWVDPNDIKQQQAEREANWFAAEFLMPRDEFTRVFREGGVALVKEHFSVSAVAAEIRAKTLNLL